MPTGYTAPIADKNIDFPTFAMNCARSFGYLACLRDSEGEAIPKTIVPSPYHKGKIEEAEAALRELANMTTEECDAAAHHEWQQQGQSWRKYEDEKATTRERYERMLAMVLAWKHPPDHRKLKDFMIEQIKRSIECDCFVSDAPTKLTGKEWRTHRLMRLEKSLQYHTAEMENERERAAAATKWVAELRASLHEAQP